MADEPIIGSGNSSNPDGPASGKITETISIPLSIDMTPSQITRAIRQVTNILHAMVSNAMRYAAIGDGRNAGAAFPVHQQLYTAAANLDNAATTLENGQRQVLTGQLPPPPGGMGRA